MRKGGTQSVRKILEALRGTILHFMLWVTGALPDLVCVLRIRGAIAACLLPGRPQDLRLGRDVTFYNAKQIVIGDHVYIAKGCWFSAGAPITIGDEVQFGPYCIVTSSTHTRSEGSFRYGVPNMAPVVIGDGAWVAAQVVISAGASVGAGTLVGAHAVVTGVLPANVFAAGQPARVVRWLNTDDQV